MFGTIVAVSGCVAAEEKVSCLKAKWSSIIINWTHTHRLLVVV